jgi:hypothetical protein
MVPVVLRLSNFFTANARVFPRAGPPHPPRFEIRQMIHQPTKAKNMYNLWILTMTTSEKMRYSSLSFCKTVLFLVLVLHPEVTRASPIPFQNLDFVVDLTDETFEHETQASTGQTTGECLLYAAFGGQHTQNVISRFVSMPWFIQALLYMSDICCNHSQE